MKKVGYIYTHTNKIDGKVYVGKTVQLPEKRFGKNYLRKYKSCTAFLRALKKHGQENFKTEVILTVLDLSALNTFEAYFIQYYNSIAPNGYNLLTYDEGLISYPDEIRKKISDSRNRWLANLTEPLIAPNKKEHVKINGVRHKQCPKCQEVKTLGSFSKNPGRWDKLATYCKPCSVVYKKQYDKAPLSKADFKATYSKRKDAMSSAQKERFADGKEAKKLSEERSQPVVATCVRTNKTMHFKSGLDAHSKGFNRTGVSRACRTGKPYKEYTWKKV